MDAASNRVGIGTNAPTQALDVTGAIRARSGIQLDPGQVIACPSCSAGQTITLTGQTNQTTSATGAFSFTGVRAGTLTLAYTVPSGWVNTGSSPYAASYSITLSGNGTEPGSRFTTSAGLMPLLKRKSAMSPTTFDDGVTFTMSPKSWFTSA